MFNPNHLSRNSINKKFKKFKRLKRKGFIYENKWHPVLGLPNIQDVGEQEVENIINQERDRYIRDSQINQENNHTYINDEDIDIDDQTIDKIEEVENRFRDVINPMHEDIDYPSDEEGNVLYQEQFAVGSRVPINRNIVNSNYRHFRIRMALPFIYYYERKNPEEDLKRFKCYTTEMRDLYHLVFRRLFYSGRIKNVPHPRFFEKDIKFFLLTVTAIDVIIKKVSEYDYENFRIGYYSENKDMKGIYVKTHPKVKNFAHKIKYNSLSASPDPFEISRSDIISDHDTIFRYTPPEIIVGNDLHLKAIIFPINYQRHEFYTNSMSTVNCTSVYFDQSPPRDLHLIKELEQQKSGWLPFINDRVTQYFYGADMAFGLVDVVMDTQSWMQGLPEDIPSEFITDESHFRFTD